MTLLELITGKAEQDQAEAPLPKALLGELKDLYSAETQLVDALPKMEKAATNSKLKAAFRSHLSETKTHVKRLEQIGKLLKTDLTGETCAGMKGLITEGDKVKSEAGDDKTLLDALLIGAAQRVEHYEIAAYGTARAMAATLGRKDVAKLLNLTIKEEGAADKKLTQISEREVLMKLGKSGNPKKSTARSKGTKATASRSKTTLAKRVANS